MLAQLLVEVSDDIEHGPHADDRREGNDHSDDQRGEQDPLVRIYQEPVRLDAQDVWPSRPQAGRR
jgi:hypothetical protein